MSSLASLARLGLFACLPLLAVACVVESTESGPSVQSGGGSATPPSTAEDAGATGDGGPSAYPILAQVETNQTMKAQPGQGVGVFTEYVAGGQWHVWWTCDTSVNPGDSCPFDVKVTVASGTIADVASQQFTTTDSLTAGSQQLEAVTTTTTDVQSVTFDTTPGATITLSATIGQQYDGQFIFFVDNGHIDDGYQGTLTDPIRFEPTSP